MTKRSLLPSATLLAATLLVAGCGGVSGPSNNRQLDFPGTLEVGGQNVHPFVVTKNGEYELRITALSAGPNVPLGLSLGASAPGGGCSVLREGPAVLNQLAMSGPMPSGNYCIAIFDIGFLSAASTYTVRASVP